MNIQTISMKQLREDFMRVKTAMDDGQSLLLLYRSKPLAEIKPVRQVKRNLRLFSQKQINQWIIDDQLTSNKQKQIDAIINRLS